MKNELGCPHCGKTKTRITKKRKAKTYGWYNGRGEPLLKYIYYVTCGCCHSRGPTADTEDEAIAAWNRRANDWVSVEERLPDIGMPVIICIGGNHVTHAYRLSSGSWVQGNYIITNKHGVAHWKHLPEPPKGE